LTEIFFYYDSESAGRSGETMEKKNENSKYFGGFISRVKLAARWDCSYRTIIRREKRKELRPIVFSGQMIRYSLEDIERIEREGKVGCDTGKEVIRV
jgi:hypothetical protein